MMKIIKNEKKLPFSVFSSSFASSSCGGLAGCCAFEAASAASCAFFCLSSSKFCSNRG